MLKLRNIYFEVSGSCNLTCKHCYIFRDNRMYARPNRLTAEIVERTVREAMRLGLQECTFTGGEILLRRDIIEILERCAPHVQAIHLLTNLTLLTDAHVDALKRLPTVDVSTSIDGLAETHDAFRGRSGAYDLTIANIRRLRSEGIKTKASVTIGSHNLAEASKIFDQLDAEGIPFSLARIASLGRGTSLMEEHNEQFDAAYTRLLAQRLGRVLTRDQLLSAGPAENDIANHCGVGIDILYVMSDGEVGFCPTLAPYIDNRFRLGSILEKSISEIWRDGEAMTAMTSACSNQRHCDHATLCRSGCRANAYLATGELGACDSEMRTAFDELKASLNFPSPIVYQVV